MNILFIGDLVGKAGLRVLEQLLDRMIDRHRIDFTIVNGENAADGYGITPELARRLIDLGVDCITSGNHIWDKREIVDYMDRDGRLLRPVNYPAGSPGSGAYVGEAPSGAKVGVINIMGRVFMPAVDDPFRAARHAVDQMLAQTRVVIVDMHAEATSEKIAMGWHLDGLASAVIGTHTHVQTADERILPKGTAYITDVGMTGPYDSIIGMDKEIVLAKFLTMMPARMSAAKGDPRLACVVVDVEGSTGRSRGIQRFCLAAAP